MKNLNIGATENLKINQSGVDRMEIDQLLLKLQSLSELDRCGNLDSLECDEALEPALA